MNVAIAALAPARALTTADVAEARKAPWLHSPYAETTWSVSDTHDPTRTETLDFSFPLANGECLTQSPSFLATLREYAFWVRSSRFTQVESCRTQFTYVRALMHIAHSLTLRGIYSFADVTPYELEQLVEDCRFGSDALLRASDRVEKYLNALRAAGSPLPRYSNNGRDTNYVDFLRVIEACHLPAGVANSNSRVAWLIGRAARQHGLLTKRVWEDDDEIPPLSNLTSIAIQRYLDPLELLYLMRHKIVADTLTFRPFPRGAAALAKRLGNGPQRTPVPPPRLALRLMERSAEWVTEYGPALLGTLARIRGAKGSYHERCQQIDAFSAELPTSGLPGSPWPLVLRGRDRAGCFTFSDAIGYLAAACFVLIATFTARRHDEILDLEADCLRGNDKDGWWLYIYIEKTLQRKEWIPVPHVVARAVELLLELSREARRETGTHELFQWLSPFSLDGEGNVFCLQPHAVMDSFADHVGVPLHQPKKGPLERWHWSPHQFRRFFAILYFYRFDGDIESLSHQLRHFNLEMTRRYVTMDPEVAAIWTDAEWGYTADVARAIVAGSRAVQGGMGTRLKTFARRIVNALRAKLQVVDPDRVGAALALAMRRKGLVLTPKPWVICSCPRTREAAARAACRIGEPLQAGVVGPNFANASPSVCAGCPFPIVDEPRQRFIDAEIGHLNDATLCDVRSETLFGVHETLRLVDLKRIQQRAADPSPQSHEKDDLIRCGGDDEAAR